MFQLPEATGGPTDPRLLGVLVPTYAPGEEMNRTPEAKVANFISEMSKRFEAFKVPLTHEDGTSYYDIPNVAHEFTTLHMDPSKSVAISPVHQLRVGFHVQPPMNELEHPSINVCYWTYLHKTFENRQEVQAYNKNMTDLTSFLPVPDRDGNVEWDGIKIKVNPHPLSFAPNPIFKTFGMPIADTSAMQKEVGIRNGRSLFIVNPEIVSATTQKAIEWGTKTRLVYGYWTPDAGFYPEVQPDFEKHVLVIPDRAQAA